MLLSKLIFLAYCALLHHPFYMSVTQMDYNAQSRSFEVAVKVFTNDMEEALKKKYNVQCQLLTTKEHPKTDEYLNQYLQSRFQLKVEGVQKDFVFVGKEKEDDACWVYLEFPDIASPRKLYVSQQILTEMFATQNNIVHVKVGKTQKSLMLNRSNNGEYVEFE